MFGSSGKKALAQVPEGHSVRSADIRDYGLGRSPGSIASALGHMHFWYVLVPVLPVLAGFLWVEIGLYDHARAEVEDHARHAGHAYATTVSNRLTTQFIELDFMARSVLGPDADPENPSDEVQRILRRFISLHPTLYAFNIQSPDGNRILWSTESQSHRPITSGANFTALKVNPNFLLGQDRYSKRVGAPVITMRYRMQGANGKTRFFVGSPYRLDRLLTDGQTDLPWRFTVTDLRDGSTLGTWQGGQVHFDASDSDDGVLMRMPDFPLAVRVHWPANMVMQDYLKSALIRWVLELLVLGLLAAAGLGIIMMFRQRDRDAMRLKRLSEFNAMLAQVNQLISTTDDAGELLRQTCVMAIRYGHLKLAWIGRPDDQGRFEVLASSGEVSYLDDLFVSIDPEVPEGHGPAAKAWRERLAFYNQSCAEDASKFPWRDRALKLGLEASAALPIFRGKGVWAVLNVYHAQANIWDDELRSLLEELAQDISRGLTHVDTYLRERQLEHDLEHARNYQRTLFERNAAGIFLVDRNRIIVDVNPAICAMTGYSTAELVGHSTSMLHIDQAAYEDFANQYQYLDEKQGWAHKTIHMRRKEGDLIVVQLLGAMVTLTNGEPGVIWSVIDITAQLEAQEQIRHQALHDALTHLPNRRSLDQYLPKAIARARRKGEALAVGMLDLDDFKPVNDTWGHEAGDRLLRELTSRLLALLRESDLLARMGGDEFVIVLEELDADHALKQLTVVLERLHQAVESPFVFGNGQTAEVGMTLGIALYPYDGEDGDNLLRQADAAMYQAKQSKHERKTWWRHGATGVDQPEQEQEFDAYGAEAAQLLKKAQPYFHQALTHFIDAFYDELDQDPETRTILNTLTPNEMEQLKQKQRDHWQVLLSPHIDKETVENRARRVGEIHVLVGVTSVILSRSVSFFRQLLSKFLNQALLPARERYRISLTVETRLQDDVQEQLMAEGTVLGAYFNCLSAPLPPLGSLWADVSVRNLGVLGALPGIQAATLMRLGSDGRFAIIHSAGSKAAAITSMYQKPDMTVVIDPDQPQGQALCAVAWRKRQIVSSASFALDPHYAHWLAATKKLGIRSVLAVPIVSPAGQAEAVLIMYGAFPNQFESQPIQQFSRGIQQRWEQLWERCNAPASSIPEDRASSMRQELFAGGLRMYMQPMISLERKVPVKVEALARLQLESGEVIAPGAFLPLLGDAELNRLFRMGLNITLKQLVAWEAAGVRLDVSVNLPPCALLDESSPKWVQEALLVHGVAPERLTLELLETQLVDPVLRDTMIHELLGLGIQLAMDDLGSGYSSLVRLSAIPFNTIKVDQGLLLRLRENPIQTISLVSSIIQMGRDFDREVVVEGIEDLGMLEMTQILGADLAQGFVIAQPMPADTVAEWSRGYEAPFDGGALQTYLGALTYHWWYMHHLTRHHPMSEEQCPLRQFLMDQGQQDSDVWHWHGEIHAKPPSKAAAQKLMAWLVEQVKNGAI